MAKRGRKHHHGTAQYATTKDLVAGTQTDVPIARRVQMSPFESHSHQSLYFISLVCLVYCNAKYKDHYTSICLVYFSKFESL